MEMKRHNNENVSARSCGGALGHCRWGRGRVGEQSRVHIAAMGRGHTVWLDRCARTESNPGQPPSGPVSPPDGASQPGRLAREGRRHPSCCRPSLLRSSPSMPRWHSSEVPPDSSSHRFLPLRPTWWGVEGGARGRSRQEPTRGGAQSVSKGRRRWRGRGGCRGGAAAGSRGAAGLPAGCSRAGSCRLVAGSRRAHTCRTVLPSRADLNLAGGAPSSTSASRRCGMCGRGEVRAAAGS
jgi:hypothetical protein